MMNSGRGIVAVVIAGGFLCLSGCGGGGGSEPTAEQKPASAVKEQTSEQVPAEIPDTAAQEEEPAATDSQRREVRAPTPPPPQPSEEEMEKRKKEMEEARNKLDALEWTMKVIETGSRKTEEDTFIFAQNKFLSRNFHSKGYGPSNYSIRVKDEGEVVWETMQAHEEDKGTLFWRGELDEETMRGVVNLQPGKGDRIRYRFQSIDSKKIKNPDQALPQEEEE